MLEHFCYLASAARASICTPAPESRRRRPHAHFATMHMAPQPSSREMYPLILRPTLRSLPPGRSWMIGFMV